MDGIKVTSIAGKGLGVVATKEYEVGDLIISEKPIFTCGIVGRTSEQELGKEIEKCLGSLDEDTRNQFFELSDCHMGDGNGKTALGIFKTNAHPCGFKTSAKRSGILLLICRINHSCCPNATHSWNENRGEQMIYASKSIQTGDEILITYRDNFGDRQTRKSEIQSLWRFSCDCPACRDDAPEESNRRRIQIEKLDSLIYNSIAKGSYELGIKFCEKRLALLKEEGEDTPKEKLKTQYDAYQACKHSGDDLSAANWGRLALQSSILAYGPDYAQSFKKELDLVPS